MDALVIAGGRGTRLQPLTYTRRKELLPLCGVPFLAGVVRRLADNGVDRLHLVVGADPSPFGTLEEHAGPLGVRVDAVTEPEPLDTAGGARSIAERLAGPTLVLNGDVLTDVDYAAVVDHHRRTGADTTIVLTEVEDTSSYGVAVRDGTRVRRFVEKPAPGTLPDERAVNAGTYVIEPEVLLSHPEGRLSFERDVFPALLAAGGHVEGVIWSGVWQDLGTPARYREGHRLALDGELDWPGLDEVPEVGPGVRIAASARVDGAATLHAPVLVLDGARIAPTATIGPHAVIGPGTTVAAGARVAGLSILHERVTIGEGVAAVGLIAGRGASVHAGAELGRDVVLGDGQSVPGDATVTDGERRPPRRD